MNLFIKTKDYTVSGEEFHLMYDQQNDMLITQPQPKQQDQYYQSEDYISHTDTKRNFLERLYHIVKQYSLKKKCSLIENFSGASKSLLDIGAGTGDFLLSAKKRGWQVKGVEPNPLARNKALNKGLSLIEDSTACKNEKFEVITLWHVLEHLPDLENQIRQIVSLLEESGTLILAVPNFKSDDAAYYKHFWAAYDVPRHLWHFSQTAISNLFSENGMKVIKVKPMIFDSFYVSLLSEKYKNGKPNYVRAFYQGFKSNLKAMKTGEYSSLIYILKKG
ncbi:class I SAM-dependent methyltransferase [Muriicola sp. Z0-33]|uniref:class I SAM-dependent methyltransferase n=1 Tax=Muriicola sp. Z0-33 TaxID=2816957 RepID=UPI002237D945|nr:class I SAM-dependent methyltransferase [Muriicola sp. Z0-33]MCW5514669.1 class I SAM-dependent methyltransferase [Muriicola sp. Z0-33]